LSAPRRIVVTTHQGPDGDGMGSSLAMYHFLKKQGHDVSVITPTFGSIVQNGKFAACALAFDKQLNRVDLPTLGSPTIPH